MVGNRKHLKLEMGMFLVLEPVSSTVVCLYYTLGITAQHVFTGLSTIVVIVSCLSMY